MFFYGKYHGTSVDVLKIMIVPLIDLNIEMYNLCFI